MSATDARFDPLAEATEPVVVTTGAGVLRGWSWKLAATMLPQLYALAISVVAARVLGPDLLGRRSFIFFVELSAISLLSGGLPPALMRFVAETTGADMHRATRRLISVAWRIEIAAALVGFALLAGIAASGADPQAAWLLAAVVCATGIFQTVPAAVLRGLQRWREAAIVGIVTGGAGMAAIVVVLLLGGGITGMFAVEVAMAMVGLLWTGRYARQALPRIRPPWGRLNPELRKGFKGFAAGSFVVVVIELIVFKRSEFFFLDHYSTDAEIAYYAVAFALVNGLVRLPGAAAAVLTPAIAHLFGAGQQDRIRSGFGRAFRLINLLAFTVVAFAVALGPDAIRLIWGEEYERAGDVLLVMASASVFVPLATISGALLSGVGRIRVPIAIGLAAAAVDIGLAFALVPELGAVGAAAANAGAQATIGLMSFAYALRVIGPIRIGWAAVGQGAGVAATAGAAAWAVQYALAGPVGLVAGLVVGGAVLLGVSSTVGVLAGEDAVWLGDSVQGRMRRPVGWLTRRAVGPGPRQE